MAKKTQSKPMKEILTRLQEFEYIRMVVFAEDVILNDPVESWPICDCLISFHSKGFPLEKAIQYAQLRRPYVINNLHMQYDIQVVTMRNACELLALVGAEGIIFGSFHVRFRCRIAERCTRFWNRKASRYRDTVSWIAIRRIRSVSSIYMTEILRRDCR